MICFAKSISSHFLKDYAPELGKLCFSSSKIVTDKPLLHEKIIETALCFFQKDQLFRVRTVLGILDIFRILTEGNDYELSDGKNEDDLRILRMRKWQDLIEERADTAISLNDLAKEEDLSPTYVSHLFRDYFGIGFQEYLNNLRFEKALFLLNSTRMPVFDLALAAGFSDPKYLNEQFRKHFGCSIKTYRRQNANSSENSERSLSLSERMYFDAEALKLLRSYC